MYIKLLSRDSYQYYNLFSIVNLINTCFLEITLLNYLQLSRINCQRAAILKNGLDRNIKLKEYIIEPQPEQDLSIKYITVKILR